MTKQIIAIGGGGFGRSYSKPIIEKYILKQSEKKKPNICFIPTATGDDDSYKVSFYSTFSHLNCYTSHLDLFKRTPNLENLISSQDIVFVGGGNTKSMLAVWREWGLDRILNSAYEDGTIMCGVSAGAICWFETGITDSWKDKLRIINCLGFVSGSCCPHYDEEPERKPYLRNFLNEGSLKHCNAIEGGCALHIKDGVAQKAIAFSRNKNAYLVKKKDKLILENPYEKEEIS